MVKVNKTDKLVFDLHMHQVDYNKQREDALRREISDKYGVPLRNVTINFVPITVDDQGDRLSLASDVIANIQNPAFQQMLFKDYIHDKEIDGVDFEDIKAIDESVNAFVDFDSYSQYAAYKFKYVKWDNYLSYGKGNFFDFTKLKGLVLLNGQPENQCGKTTFAIDLLRFALFGKAHKSPDLGSVFNIYRPEDTEVMVEACIEINGVDYVIRRTVTRPSLSKRTEKSKAKQKVEYFKLIKGEYEQMENCEGESGTETNDIIRRSVGSLEDYNLIISATSKNLGDLLDMGQTDKGRLFSRWLGLLSIERKEEVAKKMWKDNILPKLLSNTNNRADIEKEIVDIKAVIAEDTETLKSDEKRLKESNGRILEYENRKTEAMKGRKDVKDGLSNIDVTTLENKMKILSENLDTKRAEMKNHKDSYAEVKEAKFEQTDMESAVKSRDAINAEIHRLDVENAGVKTQIKAARTEIERIQRLISGGKCPTCGQDIDVVKQNDNIGKKNDEVKTLIDRGVANKKKIDEYALEKVEAEKRIAALEEDRKKAQTKANLEIRMVAVKTNIDNIKLQMADTQRQMAEIEQNKENIRHNNEIELKIRAIDESIRSENAVKESIMRSISDTKAEMASLDKRISEREEMIKTLTAEEKTIRNWTLYQQMVGKNGIVKIVLKRALPVINNEVDRLLDGLCDFKVEVTVSDDNRVCMDLVRGGQRLDLGSGASGFETVMASIALRHSLAGVATLPKPNFTVLDEVLDGVAVSNYENVRELFSRMSNSYDFIIHITHNEMLNEWHDMNVCVSKGEDMVSTIALK